MMLEVTPEGHVICAWTALCGNESTGYVDHPVLGPVPTCTRCATAHDLEHVECEVLFDLDAMSDEEVMA